MTPVEPAVSGRLGPPASRRLLTGSAGRRPALPIGSADLRQGSGDHRHEARLDADVPAPAPAVDRLDEQALVLRIGAHDVELGVEGAVGVEGQLALFLAVLVSPCLLRVFVGPPAVPGSGGQRGRLVAQTLLRAPPRAGLAADAVHHVLPAHDHAGVVREAVVIVVGVCGAVRFRPASELTPQAIATICEQVRVRVLRWFARSGLIHSDDVCETLAGENSGFSLDAEVWGLPLGIARAWSGCCAIGPAPVARER
jgi:hypothetical protein